MGLLVISPKNLCGKQSLPSDPYNNKNISTPKRTIPWQHRRWGGGWQRRKGTRLTPSQGTRGQGSGFYGAIKVGLRGKHSVWHFRVRRRRRKIRRRRKVRSSCPPGLVAFLLPRQLHRSGGGPLEAQIQKKQSKPTHPKNNELRPNPSLFFAKAPEKTDMLLVWFASWKTLVGRASYSTEKHLVFVCFWHDLTNQAVFVHIAFFGIKRATNTSYLGAF